MPPEPMNRFAALNRQPSTPEPAAEPRSVNETISLPNDRTTGRPKGKRSHPDFEKVGLYLHSVRRKQAERKWDDEGEGDFSDLIDKLLRRYLDDR